MKRIAGAVVGILAVVGALLYAVWPIVSGAAKGGDDAPIRVRNGSVCIDSGYDDPTACHYNEADAKIAQSKVPQDQHGQRKWKWSSKSSCQDSRGIQAPCFSREPKNDNHASEDTQRNPNLYVKVNTGQFGTCTDHATTASGELVEFWLTDSKVPYFLLRRNTSGFFHYRAQLLPQRPFSTHDDGETLTYGTTKDIYIKSMRVGNFSCSFSAYDPNMEVLICSPWQREDGCDFVPGIRPKQTQAHQ
jgi:hypothetical protein